MGLYISNQTLKAALVSAGIFGLANAAVIQAGCYLIAATIATAMPLFGWITGTILCVYAYTFAGVAANALVEGKGVHVRLALPWAVSFSVG